MGSGEILFCIYYIKMVSFMHSAVQLTTCFENKLFFQKGHLSQKGGCQGTLDTPTPGPLGSAADTN